MVDVVRMAAVDTLTRLLHEVARAYRRDIVASGRLPQVLVLVSFLLTFAAVRGMAHAIRDGRGPWRNVKVGGTHVHHLVPGIVLLLLTGYLGIALDIKVARRVVAVFFGIGAALTLDEFALWVHLEDVYFTHAGRHSVRVVLGAAAAAGLVLIGIEFWVDIGHIVGRRL